MDSEALFPIRDVSRITGVNPVTLRAWQRRYGLIKPARTESGHRLYSSADIEQIQTILGWLKKGVSIGQVKTLLQDGALNVADDTWGELHTELLQLALEFKLNRLGQRLEELARLYPADLWIRQIIEPWLHQLSITRRPDQNIIEQTAQRLLEQRIERMISIQGGPLIALLQFGQLTPLSAKLARYELQGLECRCVDLGVGNPRDLALIADRLKTHACMVQLGTGLSQKDLQHSIPELDQPCLLFGEAGQIYQQQGWLEQPYAPTLQQLSQQHETAFSLV